MAFGIDPSADAGLQRDANHDEHLVREFVARADDYVESGFLDAEPTPAEIIRWATHQKLAFHPVWFERLFPGGDPQQKREIGRATRRLAGRAKYVDQRQKLIRDWAKAPYWSLEEGIALMHNLDPLISIKSSVTGWEPSSLAGSKSATLHLRHARTAAKHGEISWSMKPYEFLDWAPDIGVDVDPAWTKAVPRPLPEPTSGSRDEFRIDGLELTHLDMEFDEKLKAALQHDSTKGATLLPKERDSLLKLVIGMAISGYKFDPKRERNEATAEIAGDLDLLGIGLDRGTILKWLREGAELLPRGDERD